MKAVVNLFTNKTLGAPQGWNTDALGECGSLPVHMDPPYFYSWWHVTWRERLAILFGRKVRLCIVSGAHPPVSLDTVNS